MPREPHDGIDDGRRFALRAVSRPAGRRRSARRTEPGLLRCAPLPERTEIHIRQAPQARGFYLPLTMRLPACPGGPSRRMPSPRDLTRIAGAMQSEPLSNFRPDEIATVKLGRITELLPLALRPDQLAPEPVPFSEQELARTVDQILEASEAIRAANARAAEAEARAAEFEARAREVATLATEELKAAEARNRAMEERALAAEARAEEAETRAGQTDAW